VLSNQLDELVIWQILTQIEHEAKNYGVDPNNLIKRLVYGVGTSLITSEGHPALDGVYKLVAVQKDATWLPAIKISKNRAKVPNPGNKSDWRIYDARGMATADLLTLKDEELNLHSNIRLHHPDDEKTYRSLSVDEIGEVEPLLADIMLDGKVIYDWPSIESMRTIRDHDLERLDAGVKRIMNPHIYHVSLSPKLWELKQELISSMRPTVKNQDPH
jgi:nicotinate phosphoribosyltransferase